MKKQDIKSKLKVISLSSIVNSCPHVDEYWIKTFLWLTDISSQTIFTHLCIKQHLISWDDWESLLTYILKPIPRLNHQEKRLNCFCCVETKHRFEQRKYDTSGLHLSFIRPFSNNNFQCSFTNLLQDLCNFWSRGAETVQKQQNYKSHSSGRVSTHAASKRLVKQQVIFILYTVKTGWWKTNEHLCWMNTNI